MREAGSSASVGGSSQGSDPSSGASGPQDKARDFYQRPSTTAHLPQPASGDSAPYFSSSAGLYSPPFDQQARQAPVSQVHHSAVLSSSLERGGAAPSVPPPPGPVALTAAASSSSSRADTLFPLFGSSPAVPPASSHPFYAALSLPFLLPGSDIRVGVGKAMAGIHDEFRDGGAGLGPQASALKRKMREGGQQPGPRPSAPVSSSSSNPFALDQPSAAQRIGDAGFLSRDGGGGMLGGGDLFGKSSSEAGGRPSVSGSNGTDEESRALAGILRLSKARELVVQGSGNSSSSAHEALRGRCHDRMDEGCGLTPAAAPPLHRSQSCEADERERVVLAAVPRPPAVSDDERFVELGKEAILRAYLDLARSGQASRGRTLGILDAWNTYQRLMGGDCSRGLGAELTRVMEVERVLSGLELGEARVHHGGGAQQEARGAQLIKKLTKDETGAYLWSTVVEGQHVYVCANARFSQLFFSGEELKARLWEWKLISGLVWAKVVVDDDVKKFYAAWTDTLFSHNTTTSNVVVRCRTRSGQVLPCLVTLAFHRERSPDTGAPSRTYCARLWPLVSRELLLTDPISRDVITVA